MSNVEKRLSYTNEEGKSVWHYTLVNNKGTIVKITNYGAIITHFIVKDKHNKPNDIVLGLDDPKDYISKEYTDNYPYLGAAIGRYANRVKNGMITIDGTTYQLARNSGPDNLHGGLSGFDKKIWEEVPSIPSSNPVLTLQYISADGEENFPGELTVNIRFELNDNDELIYEYTARTNKATAVNLTHHSYFNLNNGQGSIAAHEVKISAPNYLEQDGNYVVTGNLVPVAGTAHDFTTFKTVKENWNEKTGYDQSYVIDVADRLNPVAQVYSKETGLKLQILTNEPIAHFYTGSGIPEMKGKNDTTYGAFSGLCFETQKHPNAINIRNFPNTILRPGETYYTKTVYRVFVS